MRFNWNCVSKWCAPKPCGCANKFMALICTTTNSTEEGGGWLAVACGNELLVASEGTENSEGEVAGASDVLRLRVDQSPISCCGFSSSDLFLAACSDEKKLKIWRTGSWSIMVERILPKRATALQFTNDDQYILVSDKAGDLHRYPLSDSTSPGEHLLGHFSMLLDMVLSPSNSHVITCDRDEKIRVSKYPNSYNIETYCVAHTDFVTRVCFPQTWTNLLLSVSGDSTLRSWEWERGKLLDTALCSKQTTPTTAVAATDEPSKVLTQLCCSGSCDNDGRSKVIVALEACCDLLVFSLTSKGRLIRCSDADLSLPTPPWSCAFDWSDRLWVCLPHQPEPLVCYKLDGSKLVKVVASNLLKCLGQWNLLKGAEGQEKNWSQLRKQVFDNMSSYLARKEERIRSKLGQDVSEVDELEQTSQPPDKKIKIDQK